MNRAEYFVPVAVKIPGSELARAKRGGAERTVIDFIGEIREGNYTVANVRDKVDIKLSGETAGELARRPIAYDTGFTLLPGRYTLKFLARDAETGRIGTYLTTLVIPNLNKEEQRLPISSVVLSSQTVPLDEALYNAGNEKGRAVQALSPLVQNREKLIPSVTRVFNRNKEMHVYLRVLPARRGRGAAGRRLRELLSRPGEGIRDGSGCSQRGAEQPPAHGTAQAPLPARPVRARDYICQVTVLNPRGQKAAFWQAPVMIVH